MVGPAHFYLFGLGVNESAWALAAVQAKGKNIYLNQADDHIEDILDVISIQ